MLKFVSILVGLLVWALPGGASNNTESSGGSIERFGVPEDAIVFVNARSLCNPPPKTMKAAFALRCGSIQSTRECMGVSPTTPIFVGR